MAASFFGPIGVRADLEQGDPIGPKKMAAILTVKGIEMGDGRWGRQPHSLMVKAADFAPEELSGFGETPSPEAGKMGLA